jgi:hypothetical protein
VHGDLYSPGALHGDGREREAADDEYLTSAAGSGPGGEELAGLVPEDPRGVGGRVAVRRRGDRADVAGGWGDQGDMPGDGTVVQRGQGLGGVPEQHVQVPAPAW